MDSVQHAYLPALVCYANNSGIPEVIVAGAIGAAPDIIGAYGNIIKKDNNVLYNIAHDNALSLIIFLLGLSFLGASSVSGANPPLMAIGIGLICYYVHVRLDSISHQDKRWWIPKERLWLNMCTWFALTIATVFVNPLSYSFAVATIVWNSLVTGYCMVRYKNG